MFHALAMLPRDSRIFLHGGLDASGNVLSDSWSFYLESGSWELISLAPEIALYQHAGCLLDRNGEVAVVLAGGLGGPDSTPHFSVTTLRLAVTQTLSVSVEPLTGFSASLSSPQIFPVTPSTFIVFGGFFVSRQRNPVFELVLSENGDWAIQSQFVRSKGPAARFVHLSLIFFGLEIHCIRNFPARSPFFGNTWLLVFFAFFILVQ